MKARQYKAFDFISGHTYLIGEFPSKAAAMGYCAANGIATIGQTCVPLSDKEYSHALANRKREKAVNNKIAELELENMRLKAKLYDAMMEERKSK